VEKGLGLSLCKKRGTVRYYWSNGERGYCFIHPDDGGEDLFVHHTGIAPYDKAKSSLREGARVSYTVAQRKMVGLWAEDVCMAE
jgi:cold shock CspA family protein